MHALIERIKHNFPPELQSLQQWVLWRLETRHDKPTKVPYRVTGQRAASDNPSTWASFAAVCAAFQRGKYNGLGFMFHEADPYAGVDFDKCAVRTDIDAEKLAHILGLDSYTEFSPSGTGIHVLVRATLPAGGRKSRAHKIELYDRLRFFCVTGERLMRLPPTVNERQTQLEALHALIFPVQKPALRQAHEPVGEPVEPPADDQALLQRMFASKTGTKIKHLWDGHKHGYGDDDSAADLALCNYLAFWTGNDAERIDRMFRQSRLYRDKWERNARSDESYGEGTIARAIAATTQTYQPGYVGGNGHYTAMVATTTPTLVRPATASHDDHQGEAQPKRALDVLHYRAEDGGILDAWEELYSNDRMFVVGKDQWRIWDITHWRLDDSLIIQAEIRRLLDEMNRQASEYIREAPERIKAINLRYTQSKMPDSAIQEIEQIEKNAIIAKPLHMATKRTNGRIASIEGMARTERAVPAARLDISDSINLSNGTLNLHSLELLPHSKDDLFTYCLNYAYEPDATCPLFEKFIREVLVKEDSDETDPQLVMLFQELLGYSLTPKTNREVMVWMFGEGGNGKSVALFVIKALLGPMAMSVDFQSLGMPGNYDLADIPGSRVIFSTEAERGGSIAEGYIKKIVTGDPIKTRPIYGSPIDFCSTAKIWWAMNDKPVIKDTTDSIWRRMKLLPFYRKFEEGKNADVDLPQKLLAELPGILNWAIQGLIRLTVDNRFTEAAAADEAKKQYRNESNPVAQWVRTMTVHTSHPATLQGALYAHFKGWCIDNGEKPITSNQFGRDLKRLKIASKRKDAGQFYNLALIDEINP